MKNLKSHIFLVIIFVTIALPAIAKDYATQEAQYLKNIERERIKEEYGRKIMDRKPSGFMTVEEYEKLSKPQDISAFDYGIPQTTRPNDMQYVPKPVYKLAKYNNPPGSPDLRISKDIYQTRQLNLPGITAPDFSKLVYPAVYYYPLRGAITCDLFTIPLKENETSINKILKANIANRNPNPILSTDKELTNSTAFRTLTPIDFSADSKKLLVKEKVGSSADGIWQTNIIVYDFETKTSYDLVELRYAIIYYWKEYKGLDLEDKRWDIYPLGFSDGNQDRIMATAYAYTGSTPVFLGVWSIDVHGEQSRLISLNNGAVEVASNGYKIVKDGVIPNSLSTEQEKREKAFIKAEVREAKKQDNAEVKSLKKERNEKLKEVNKQYKLEKEDFKLLDKLNGTTSLNENIEKYESLQENLNQKREHQAEKAQQKQEAKAKKAEEKAQRKLEKAQEKKEQSQLETGNDS